MIVHWAVPAPTLGWLAFALSAATVGILGFTGYLGGEMAYRYRIGQIAPANGGQIPEPVTTDRLTHPKRR